MTSSFWDNTFTEQYGAIDLNELGDEAKGVERHVSYNGSCMAVTSAPGPHVRYVG